MTKVLFSSKKDDSLKTNKQAICDPNYGIYYENAECKKFIQEYLGFYCMTCKKSKNQVRKFQSLEALQEHYDKAHHLHHCDLCVQEKPVLLFE